MSERRMVLGAMYFGTRVDEATSMRLLDRYVDQGGTWIDTANCYAFWADSSGIGGQSEVLIGKWLAARPGLRERVRIATKVRHQPTVPGQWPGSAEGLSERAIRAAVPLSLQRLGTDRIDLYWAHAEDRTVPLAETVTALGELVASGTVGRLGASNHATWRLERARQLAREQGVTGYSALQLRRSYVQPRPGGAIPDDGHQFATDQDLDYARSEDLLMWVYTPLLNGGYTRPDKPFPESYEHAGTTARLKVLGEVAGELGATRNQVVLAWLAGGDPATLPIVGVSSIAQLDEAMGADTVTLEPEQRQRLDAPA
jgi:aryl-alcohol dehydrogenase-like predicted oxidoreductase